ncbi:hypothetical protein [Cloacibacillus porcorum]|uniref:hypothetical protein n=1 Tax=Cloacibacillus porcorum TaxID=1197717 RepID=UPI0023F31035|nr:hypothetical protein [Cloacibacillus porcorum]MDD7649233.1 hypothetical protein [Cloacibacillus porcorum]MDY4093554.1 hypothetical protein [Cloacibacillus porcorum]
MYNIGKIKEVTSLEEANKLLDQGWHVLDIKITTMAKNPSTFTAVLGWDRRKTFSEEE